MQDIPQSTPNGFSKTYFKPVIMVVNFSLALSI